MIRTAGSKALSFVRALVLLALIVVAIPAVLVGVARARFDGSAPFHGVASPADWDIGRIRSALTERLSDDTIADVVIRLALVITWVAVVVIVLTVVAEVVHMVRHRGVPMPDIRGLGLSQSVARVIAAGLLVVVPLVASGQRAVARDGSTELVRAPSAVAHPVSADSDAGPPPGGRPDNVWPGRIDPADVPPTATWETPSRLPAPTDLPSGVNAPVDVRRAPDAATGQYVVRAGDSIYGIAQQQVGPDPAAVADYASEMLDLNLGREMADGQRFNNAAYIDVGWVLDLPAGGPAQSRAGAPTTAGDVGHTVVEGESLWSIAGDELGDPERWPEIYDANEGRTFGDGRSLHDPDVIQPGWELDVPIGADVVARDPAPTDPVAGPLVADPIAADPIVADPEPLLPPPAIEVVRADDLVDTETVPGPATDIATDIATDPPAGGPVNVWPTRDVAQPVAARVDVPGHAVAADTVAGGTGDTSADHAVVADGGDDDDGDDDDDPVRAAGMLTFGGAAMLSGGVLTLLAVRRRQRLRRARPRARLAGPAAGPAATERALRAIDVGERLTRVELAVRLAALPLVDLDERAMAALVDDDGAVELIASGPVELPAPWEPGPSSERWFLPAALPLELLAEQAAPVAMPSPTLVQLGRGDDRRDVYVDLEALEALEVGGPGADADAVVAAVAATLAGSLWAEVATLVGVGVPDHAFLGHRHHVGVGDHQAAFEAASDAIGSTAAQARPTFELRARAEAGEAWEPAVVLVGAAAGTVEPPRSRSGLAIVSASPVRGPSSRLAPDGESWRLLPLDIALSPVGLGADDIAAIAELVDVPEAEPAPAVADHDLTLPPGALDDDVDARGELDVGAEPAPGPEWALLVRVLGPIDVVAPDGRSVGFERSKTRELVAWLATHRERSTRSAARTALWEQDVRDGTFNNVVSEARRALARLVEPPEGDEWVGRTMTDALPLHDLIRTDADVLAHALDTARLQPPDQAIATLTPAVEWIRAMPFEGTSYLWPDAEGLVSHLVVITTSAAAELGAHCLSVGDIDGVFSATARGLQVLPGHEDLIGLRMQARARQGDHAGVRQEWESYERVINADPWSDGEPAPQLVELRRQLLNPTR